MELRGVTARLNESPLPRLDLSVEGIGHLFASQPEERRLTPGARPLDGLATLFQVLRRPDAEYPLVPTIALEIDRLDHPVFFWPLARTDAEVAQLDKGVRVTLHRGTWAGVPIEGEVRWTVLPEQTVEARLVAHRGERVAPPALPEGTWTRGRFHVDAFEAGRWKHRQIDGRFEGGGSTLWLTDGDLELGTEVAPTVEVLVPTGRAQDVVVPVPVQVSHEESGMEVAARHDAAGRERARAVRVLEPVVVR